jgi:hypothetical protein
MTAELITDGGGLDVEYVPDSGPAPADAVAGDVIDTDSDVVEYAPTVELHGQRFPIADRGVPLLSQMKLATIAKRQRDRPPGQRPDPADELESMAIMYEMVRSCIADSAWPQFEEHANTVGAGVDDLQGVIQQTVAARANRPTQPSSGSPGGRSTTAPNSAGTSSAPASSIRQGDERVQHRLEQRGRPDLALVVQRAREASTTSSTG